MHRSIAEGDERIVLLQLDSRLVDDFVLDGMVEAVFG